MLIFDLLIIPFLLDELPSFVGRCGEYTLFLPLWKRLSLPSYNVSDVLQIHTLSTILHLLQLLLQRLPIDLPPSLFPPYTVWL